MASIFGRLFMRYKKRTASESIECVEDEIVAEFPFPPSYEPDDEGTVGLSPILNPSRAVPKQMDCGDDVEGTVGLDAEFDYHSPLSRANSRVNAEDMDEDESTIGYRAMASQKEDEQTIGGYAIPGTPQFDDNDTIVPCQYQTFGEDDDETIDPYAASWKPSLRMVFRIEREQSATEKSVDFGESMEIGRDAECGLRLQEEYVSRHHIRLTTSGGTVYAVNLSAAKTSNYTRLNQSLLGTVPQKVKTSDCIEIFNLKIIVQSISVIS